MDIHDQIKLFKVGYSKVTDHAVREIRHKRLDRNTGISLIKKYERKKILFDNLFFKWIGMKDQKNSLIFDVMKNNKYWLRKDVKKYKFNGLSKYLKYEKSKNKKTKKIYFINNSNINLNEIPNYITFGKGIK